MKRIALISCSVCLILGVIYFINKNKDDSPTREIIKDVKIKKELDVQRKRNEKKKLEKTSKNETKSEKADEKPKDDLQKEIKEELKEEPKEHKALKTKLKKRNKYYMNSTIEVVDIDKLAKKSSVIIRTKHEGKNYSFSALIDNETGKILKTWGRTIFENRKK